MWGGQFMQKKRKSSNDNFPRVSRAVCFSGEEGYKLLEVYDEEGKKFKYGKSSLIMELLKLYKEALKVYGDKDTIFKMRTAIEKDREKE